MSPRPTPTPPHPGQESVWDYPRPPALKPTGKRLIVRHRGRTLADTTRGYRVLETSHPPVYYFPPDDINFALLDDTSRTTFCEWKYAGKVDECTVDPGSFGW